MADQTRRPFSRRDVLLTATGAAAALSVARVGSAQAPPPGPAGSMLGVPFERRTRCASPSSAAGGGG